MGYAVGAVTAAATAYGAVQAKKKRDDAGASCGMYLDGKKRQLPGLGA